MPEIKVEVGATLPKDVWLEARDNLQELFGMIAAWLERANVDGMGKQDTEEFTTHAMLALSAMTYVAEFARDKCRIIVLPKKEGEAHGTADH